MKGINKMIVEINNTDSEYFEKAILFIKPQKQEVRTGEITKNADALLKAVAEGKAKKEQKQEKIVLKLLIASFAGALFSAVTLLIIFQL